MTQSEIKKIIEDNPGILQSELHKLSDLNLGTIPEQVQRLVKKREITRVKYKNTNKLYIS